MSYFPEDIPFMSKEELRENGIRIPKDATDINVGDTISRQQAIDIVVFECGKWTGLAKEIIKQLKQLPPAQPERQKGEWIDYTEDGYVECPFCHSATNCDGNKDELHFCFSCGADMRGEQHEAD